MLLENVARNVASTGIMKSSRATIKATPKIFNFFADQTYANKPQAIVRELTANALDSHTAAGTPTRPVEVTLPTELDPIFKVRDFGIGMSQLFLLGDDDTPSQFMAYTDGSTKDGSNDQIGGFGIGSKSPFAYTDQFTIRSVHQGVLVVCSVYKAEDGVPEIGLLGATTTDEANGVEVSFPVEADDIATFHEAAQQALQFFQPMPVVIGGDVTPPDYTYQGNGWALRPEAGDLGVIMGGVRYPVTTYNLDYTALRGNSRLSPLLGYGLDLFLPIGACGVALSREALSYSGNTSASIAAALEGLHDDVVATFGTMFEGHPTLWSAMAALGTEVGFNDYATGPRAQLLSANARYRGQKLTTTIRDLSTVRAMAWYIEPKSGRRSMTSLKTAKWETIGSLGVIQPGNIEAVFVDDLEPSPKFKAVGRIRQHVLDNLTRTKGIVCLRPAFNGDMTTILHQLGDPEVIYASTLDMPRTKARAKNTDRPKVRMFTFNGENDRWTKARIDNLMPAKSKELAVAEVDYKDQPAEGIMVVMDSFALPGNFYQRMATGLFTYDELHFVNQGDAPKLKASWTTFDDAFAERLADQLAYYPELPARLALSRSPALQRFYPRCVLLQNEILTAAQQRRPFGRIVQLWNDYIAPLTNDQHRLAPFVTAALPARVEPDKLVAAFLKEQADVGILLDVLNLSDKKHVALLLKNL